MASINRKLGAAKAALTRQAKAERRAQAADAALERRIQELREEVKARRESGLPKLDGTPPGHGGGCRCGECNTYRHGAR